ncbi:hypothetical protein B0H13DRAFT_1875515 [Mycena leptocephala]|nr:hypothetical protein B0H13DRAFT_1875515 [Mycena leptocephala]
MAALNCFVLVGSHGHLSSLRHYYESSSQDAKFSVEPGQSNTQLTVGAGCVFDEIYKVIRAEKYNIVGGGSVQIVLPDGKVVTATEQIESGLFWAIKGGGNNFGLATEFVWKTHRQGTDGYVYHLFTVVVSGAGFLLLTRLVERVKMANVNFMKLSSPLSGSIGTIAFRRLSLQFLSGFSNSQSWYFTITRNLNLILLKTSSTFLTTLDTAATFLYNYIPVDVATTILSPPEDDTQYSFPSSEIAGLGVMNAQCVTVETVQEKFPSLVVSARWGNVMVSEYTQNLVNVVEEEAKVNRLPAIPFIRPDFISTAKQLMEKHQGRMVVADIWPFLPNMFDNSVDSAWPHKRGAPNGPLLVYFMWEGKENDVVWIGQMKTALDHIHRIALQEECTTPNALVY